MISTWPVTGSDWPGTTTTPGSSCPWAAWRSTGWPTWGGWAGSATTSTRSSRPCWTSSQWTAVWRRRRGAPRLTGCQSRVSPSSLSSGCAGKYSSWTAARAPGKSAWSSLPGLTGRRLTSPETSMLTWPPRTLRSGSSTEPSSGTTWPATSPHISGWCWSTWASPSGRWGSPAWGSRPGLSSWSVSAVRKYFSNLISHYQCEDCWLLIFSRTNQTKMTTSSPFRPSTRPSSKWETETENPGIKSNQMKNWLEQKWGERKENWWILILHHYQLLDNYFDRKIKDFPPHGGSSYSCRHLRKIEIRRDGRRIEGEATRQARQQELSD